MPDVINLNKKKEKRDGTHTFVLVLSDDEHDMLVDLARSYGLMWRGKPNRQGTIKYMLRAVFGMLTRGEKI